MNIITTTILYTPILLMTISTTRCDCETPSLETNQEFTTGICCPEYDRKCLCSTNPDLTINMSMSVTDVAGRRIDAYDFTQLRYRQVPCGMLVSRNSIKNRLAFMFLDFNLVEHKKYMILFVDADASEKPYSWALWIRTNVRAWELKGVHFNSSRPLMFRPSILSFRLPRHIPQGDDTVRRLQLYLFEYDKYTVINSVRDWNRGSFRFNQFVGGNKLCNSLVAGTQLFLYQTTDAVVKKGRDQFTSCNTCGIATLCAWPSATCGDTAKGLASSELSKRPNITFSQAIPGQFYNLVMYVYNADTNEYYKCWSVWNIKAEDIEQGKNEGQNYVDFHVPQLNESDTYYTYLYVRQQASRFDDASIATFESHPGSVSFNPDSQATATSMSTVVGMFTTKVYVSDTTTKKWCQKASCSSVRNNLLLVLTTIIVGNH